MFSYGCTSTLTNVAFENNITQGVDTYDNGGGMFNQQSTTILNNVTFSGNQSAHYGRGLYNLQNNNTTLTNVTFSGNSAVRGGGMMNWITSDSNLLNVTFYNNSATESGGGLYNYSNSSTEIENGIFWGNTPDQTYTSGSILDILYCDIQDGPPSGVDVT